jgi:16S rRNA (cytosine1402-N4)-methyltransferase
LEEREIADVIYKYGEERFSRRIARRIVDARNQSPIKSAAQLADLVRRSVPRSPKERIDPATRTFQALRIAVNQELESLELALARLPDRLKPGGRLAIISFHSLEDRLVKEAFRSDPRLEPLTKKPIIASDEEIAGNPRSRSAKLRVAARRQ